MEQKTIERLPNPLEQEVIDDVTSLLIPIISYLALNNELFPFVCHSACNIIKTHIDERYDYKLTLCNGSRYNTTTNIISRKHTWLEFDNLIIDLTDFQFSVISNELSLTDENMIPEGVCLDGLSEEESDKIFLQTYVKKLHEEYLNNPSEKEKRFQEQTNLLKDKQIDSKTYIDILRDEYGLKVFYNKLDRDSNITYTTDPRDAAEF